MRVALAASLLLAACGGSTESAPSDASSDVADTLPDAPSDVATDARDDVAEAPDPCAEAVDALTKTITGTICTSMVRLSFETRTPLGWQIACGKLSPPTEADARVALSPFVAPYTKIDSYAVVAVGSPDPWVFYASPGDFGGIGVVSARTGLPTFAGGVVWAGRGEIAFPKSFRPASELSATCPALPHPAARGWVPDMMKDDRQAALDAVFTTPLPRALSRIHAFNGGFVVGYPRSVGAFDAKSAEWIVIIESALLE